MTASVGATEKKMHGIKRDMVLHVCVLLFETPNYMFYVLVKKFSVIFQFEKNHQSFISLFVIKKKAER